MNKRNLYMGLIAVLACVILLMLVIRACSGGQGTEVPTASLPTTEVVRQTVIKEVEVPKIVEIEKEITISMIEDGLHDMGVLVTADYYFTNAVSFSKVKSLFNLVELGFTETSYLATYDGVVTAGIDFEQVSAAKNDELKLVTVTLPHAQIQNIDVDPESFVLISEKTGVGNPLKVEEVNASLIELEKGASDKALANGLLDRADENAKKIVENFIRSMLGDEAYNIEIVYR